MNELPPPPALAAPTVTAPTCHNTICTGIAIVQWQRRLTDEELAVEHAIIQGRRSAEHLMRDTALPEPEVPPLPGPHEFTRAVHACGDHAIHLEAAARIHQGSCTGPDGTQLPACDCEPEPLPGQDPLPEQQLPGHWAAAMAGASG